MIPALPRQGRLGAVAFAILEHDPALPLRPQRDRAGAAIPGLLGCAPDRVSLRRSPGGRPLLYAGAPTGCSIAHSRWWTLVAVAPGCELGVDLETVRPDLPLDEVAAAFFTADELARLRAVPPCRRALATTLLWSAKEALLKATGLGIAAGLHTPLLDGLDVSPLLDGAAGLFLDFPGRAGIHLRHGLLGTEHLAMAAVSMRLGSPAAAAPGLAG